MLNQCRSKLGTLRHGWGGWEFWNLKQQVECCVNLPFALFDSWTLFYFIFLMWSLWNIVRYSLCWSPGRNKVGSIPLSSAAIVQMSYMINFLKPTCNFSRCTHEVTSDYIFVLILDFSHNFGCLHKENSLSDHMSSSLDSQNSLLTVYCIVGYLQDYPPSLGLPESMKWHISIFFLKI